MEDNNQNQQLGGPNQQQQHPQQQQQQHPQQPHPQQQQQQQHHQGNNNNNNKGMHGLTAIGHGMGMGQQHHGMGIAQLPPMNMMGPMNLPNGMGHPMHAGMGHPPPFQQQPPQQQQQHHHHPPPHHPPQPPNPQYTHPHNQHQHHQQHHRPQHQQHHHQQHPHHQLQQQNPPSVQDPMGGNTPDMRGMGIINLSNPAPDSTGTATTTTAAVPTATQETATKRPSTVNPAIDATAAAAAADAAPKPATDEPPDPTSKTAGQAAAAAAKDPKPVHRNDKPPENDDNDGDDDDDDDDDDGYETSKESKSNNNGIPGGRHRSWDDNFAALVEYKQKHGDCLVPVSFPEDPALGRWCAKLRKIKETLKPERRARLEYLGFQFINPKYAMEDKNWHENFERLKHHYLHNDGSQKMDPVLNRWVSRQRRNKKDGIMLPQRAQKLESIGFKWVIMEQKPKDYTKKDLHWIHQYNQLVQFQKQTGHTNVPHGKGPYGSLAKWVARQRELYFQKRLLEERKQLLNTLGFIWSMEEKAWNDNYEKLRGFLLQHGSLDFQQSGDPSIQRWFYAQRVKFANGNLSNERIQLLEEIGLRFDGTKAYLGDEENVDFDGVDANNRNHQNNHTKAPAPAPVMCQLEFPLRPPEGTKIRKKRFMEGWCNGEVIEQEESRAKVRYEDGDEEYLSDEEFRLSAIAYQLHKEAPKPARPKILVPIKRGRGRPKGSTNRNKRALPGKRIPGRPRKSDEDLDDEPTPKKTKKPDPPNLPKTPYQNIIGVAPGGNQDDMYV